MSRMPLGQGLDDAGGSAPHDSDDDDLQPVSRRPADRDRIESVQDDTRGTEAPDATVFLRQTEDPDDRKKDPGIEIVDGDQQRLNRDQRDDGREDVRDARRNERRYSKERRRQARDNASQHIRRLEGEIAELREQMAGQGGHSIRQDIAAIETRFHQAQAALQEVNAAHARAVSASDGDAAVEAINRRDEIVATMANLRSLHARAQQAARNPQRDVPQIDPSAARMGKEWMRDNPWYDPDGADEDSAIMLAIDQQLIREGYRPNTQEFWDELTERGRRRIPDKFEEREMDDDRDDNRRREVRRRDERPVNGRRGPPVGGGRDGDRNGGAREGGRVQSMYVSPDEKQAYIEAGIWDDPDRLKRVLRQRQDFDRREREKTATYRGR